MMPARDQIVGLKIATASPASLLEYSSGEIEKDATIHYAAGRPVSGGLFCARKFGPVRGWACACARHNAAALWIVTKDNLGGIVCPTCGIKSPRGRLRCDRMAHIRLAAPMLHPWFRDRPRSEQLLLEVLLVLPPDLRPAVRLPDRCRYGVHDLTCLYRRLIERNNRLKALLKCRAPDWVLEHELRLVQNAVDALIDNERLPKPLVDEVERPLSSLSYALTEELRPRNPGDRPAGFSGDGPHAADRSHLTSRLQIPVRSEAPLYRVWRYRDLVPPLAIAAPSTLRHWWRLVYKLRALCLKVTLEDESGREVRMEDFAEMLGDHPPGSRPIWMH